jgi:hypothetical protein
MRILGDANAPVLRSWGIVKFHKTRQGKARQSKARQGKARQGRMAAALPNRSIIQCAD